MYIFFENTNLKYLTDSMYFIHFVSGLISATQLWHNTDEKLNSICDKSTSTPQT